MKAIVYTSKTGHTAEYAKIIGEKMNLPVCSLKDAKKQIKEKKNDRTHVNKTGAEVIAKLFVENAKKQNLPIGECFK